MASIRKREGSWVADIRRSGHKSISKSFPTKTLAAEWARSIEHDMDANDYQDGRKLSGVTLGKVIDDYSEQVGRNKPFGKNKESVLAILKTELGMVPLSSLTAERLNTYIDDRMRRGAGGVTIAIDLTYLQGVLKTAAAIWKLPVDLMVVGESRARLKHLGVSTKSNHRERRPTDKEIADIKQFFAGKIRQKIPMGDIVDFAIATAMRQGEIIRLKWADLNEADRTIIIRNRKHPTKKEGNDQEVPLLGEAFAIVMRQPKISDRIFPTGEGTVSTLFPRACQANAIQDLHFHDLRHEGVTRLFEQGYTIEQVALVSGHLDWKMLKRYVQLRAKDLHRD